MNVTIAIDSFKGSLSTIEAGDAIKQGIEQVFDYAKVNICPMADGGEGTVDAIIGATGGSLVTATVHDPIGRMIDAQYGIIESRHTAVIEMSAASGITLVSESERNPMNTTTYGVGELICDAISKGCKKFIIGIGGSATNDGGVGMLQALGFEFYDVNGCPVPYGAIGVGQIAAIGKDNIVAGLDECEFLVACDVKNPLCGPDGCSAIYGPQKGATPEMVETMDAYLAAYATLSKTVNPDCNPDFPGSGAAGGLGFAFMAYLGARLESGIELVIKETGLEDYIKDADIVITGEGRLDGQSYMGKAPVGVAKIAKKYGKPVVAFSGCVTDDAVKCNDYGIDAFFPILKAPCSLEEAMDTSNASANLSATAQQVFNLIKTFA